MCVVTLDELKTSRRDAILELAAESGARNVRVFGSVARRQSDTESDVDFLVDLDVGRSLLDLGRLQRNLENLLHTRVDVVSSRGLRERIRQRVLEEAVPL